MRRCLLSNQKLSMRTHPSSTRIISGLNLAGWGRFNFSGGVSGVISMRLVIAVIAQILPSYRHGQPVFRSVLARRPCEEIPLVVFKSELLYEQGVSREHGRLRDAAVPSRVVVGL